jgi:tetratricopeptide (TPR) repeat protein
MADLNEAIQYVQQAVDTTPEDHPHWAVYINNLGAQLGDRYLRMGAIADLEEAIQIIRQAIDVTPESHLSLVELLSNLGVQLGSRYSRTKAKADLREAIQLTRKGLDSTPEGHPNRIVQLDSLAILLGHTYSETRAIADLKEAIQAARQAVDVTPRDHQYRARILNNLGDELGNLYLRTADVADLEEAITYLQQAVETMPQENPDRSALLGNLGDQLNSRYTKTGAIEDRQNAIACYQASLNQANSYTLSRIWAGRSLLHCALLHCAPDWQQAYAAASLTVGLVPRLSSRSLRNSDRQHALSQVVGLASDAAAAALQTGQTPLVALGLLEQGRGVLGASLEEVRTDILNLRDKDRELAEQFLHLRDELETAVTQNPQLVDVNLETPWQARASRRYEARKEFDELVAKIQKLPGFENFLLPPSETEIKDATRCGPIVVINVSKYRCDALLVEPHQIRALALTQLSIEEVEEKAWRSDLGSHEVLEWLWDKVTRQVLDALGFTHPPSPDDSWPHVWWIPTGPLSKFPLHAAGYHSARSTETVLDRVMSSYASSIKTIIHGRQRQLQPATSVQALLVAMEQTPRNDVLPFATKEVAMVRKLCGSMSFQPVEPGRRKQDVESHLRDCRIFHFAGHGGTDEHDAFNSRLILEDGTLRVAELLEMNLLERSPFLAYLSACGTGRIKDERSVDESIHLMSAFQLAGFRHVVGTLWEVRDELCVNMARITYEGMRDGAMTDESVCRGLHHASRMLRDQCLEVWSDTEDGSLPPERTILGRTSSKKPKGAPSLRDVGVFDTGLAPWAPYVHFGV